MCNLHLLRWVEYCAEFAPRLAHSEIFKKHNSKSCHRRAAAVAGGAGAGACNAVEKSLILL